MVYYNLVIGVKLTKKQVNSLLPQNNLRKQLQEIVPKNMKTTRYHHGHYHGRYQP